MSGGVWGIDRGYCLLIGGNTAAVAHLDCGPSGAGHFVKMVNGLEYALMAAYADGFNILAHANVGPVDK